MANVRRRCPFCYERTGSHGRRENVSINVDEQVFYCWRCGASGHLKASTAELLGVPFDSSAHRWDEIRSVEEPKKPAKKRQLPEGYTPLWPIEEALCSTVLKRYAIYLRSRGLTDDDVCSYKVGVALENADWRYVGSLVFPLLDPESQGWLMRRIDRRGYRNSDGLVRGSVLYNARVLTQNAGCVFVVEGAIDAIRTGCAVATLGKDISESQLSRLSTHPGDLIVAMDGDAWMYSRAICGRLRLRGKSNVTWVRLPSGEDPGSLGRAVWDLPRL